MKLSTFNASQSPDVINLFTKVFSDSEGQDEGETISRLVSELIITTDEHDIVGFVAILEKELVGCIFFSRLILPSEKIAFILSPVAIATDQQGKGIGQQLIRHGIEYLRIKDIDFVFTYGDPNFYSKVGFQQINEDIVKAPFKLTQPEGWLAQSLQSGVIDAMVGSSVCVKALNKQEYW
ncbi:MAG: N-acetyltransferase [Proteobacteria bacterium]|nr:N-acetyltransferase [Pseudomonadota bacterium]NOG61275.1 N-acetyltransferase [Pseudomonadota bacterium]